MTVCKATADKLQRHVCQYFTDLIVANPNNTVPSSSSPAPEEDFTEIATAHELIKRLNHAAPALLHSVVPQLEEELRVQSLQHRLLATQVLGEMFADKVNGPDLVKKYPTTWKAWQMRKNDKSGAVRLKFVESAKGLLTGSPEQIEVVEGVSSSPTFLPTAH